MAVKGLQATLIAFKSLEKNIQDDILDLVEETATNIEREAIALAPGPNEPIDTTFGTQRFNDNIAGFIYKEIKDRGLRAEVGIEASATPLAIYIEMGTGDSAADYVPTLEPELQAIARKYYINGKGTILKSPFLLPSFYKYSANFTDKIKSILKNRTK